MASRVQFERLILATEGERVDGRTWSEWRPCGLPTLDTLASCDYAEELEESVSARQPLIVMEVASQSAQQGRDTTMVFPEDRVWNKLFTPEMSRFFQKYYEDRGVRLVTAEMNNSC